MKHIATTTENEVIISLKMEDINELLMITNGASIHYSKKAKTEKHKGWDLMEEDTEKWWMIMYKIRETIK